MQDEFRYEHHEYSWSSVNGWNYGEPTHSPGSLRFLEVVCLGEPEDDLTVSEVICARFSDEEIQLLGLNE